MADTKINNTQPTNASTAAAKTGYQRGQDAPGASSETLAIASTSIDKGGMRGLGLLAVALAEVSLKKKAIDVARDYYKTNKKDFDFFVSTHQPAIQASVSEAMSPSTNPKYVHDYYASAPAGMAKSAILDKQWFEARRRTHRYCIGLQRRIDYDFAVRRTHGIAGGWNIGTRYEMTYADDHNNRRFDRMVEVSNVGIGVGNIVRQGLASSVGKLAASYDSIGDTVASIGNGLAGKQGYEAGRGYAASRYPKMGNE